MNELLETGILIEDADFNISFIHETYQEFFAALFLSKNYLRTKKWVASRNDSTWHEVFAMAVELVTSSLTPNERIELIDDFRLCICEGMTYDTDTNIDVLCHIFSSMLNYIPEYRNYIEQYILFIIINWDQIYDDFKKPDIVHMEKLFTAIAIISSEAFFKIIIFNKKWRDYWMTGDSSRRIKTILYTYTSDKRLLFEWVDFAAQLLYGAKLRNKLFKFSLSLLPYCTNEDLAELYEEDKNLYYLFSMTDVDYISTHIGEHDKEEINKHIHIFAIQTYSEERFNFIINTIFPIASLNTKKQLLNSYILNRYNSDYIFDYVAKNIIDKETGNFIRSSLKQIPADILPERFKVLFRNIHICVPNKDYLVINNYLKIRDITLEKGKYSIDDGNNAIIAKTQEIFPYGILKTDCYHRFELLENNNYLNSIMYLNKDDMIKIIKEFELYGFFPYQSIEINKKTSFRIIEKLTSRFAVTYTAEGQSLIPVRYLEDTNLMKGDLIIRVWKRKYYKVHNNDKSAALGYKTGIVVSRHSYDYCFIRVDGENKDYFASSYEWMDDLRVGDRVVFFPTVNYRETYRRNRQVALCCSLLK